MKVKLIILCLLATVSYSQSQTQKLNNGGVTVIDSSIVADSIATAKFRMTTSPTNGYVVTSDASGNGTWQAAAAGGDSSWTSAEADTIRARSASGLHLLDDSGTKGIFIKDGGNVGIGTTVPGGKLAFGDLGVVTKLIDFSSVSDIANGDYYMYMDANNYLNRSSSAGYLNIAYLRNYAYMMTPQIKAYDSGGLKLLDDSENYGIFIQDGGNVGIGTTAPAKNLHVMGDAAIGDTVTATNDRYLYFATDGDVTTQYVKHTQNATGYSGFYFSDSISADGYIDYCDVYEGEALIELKKIKAKPLAVSKNGFKKLDHSSLPTGTVVTFDISYWERKKDSKKMHFGFKPCMDLTPRWIETEDTSYFRYASTEDSLNFVDNFKYVKETKQGRNISKMVSVLVKAVQELTEKIEELEKK